MAVRTSSDYGLSFTVSNITQLTPLAGANLTFWGFPASPKPQRPALPQRHPRRTGRLCGSRRHQLPRCRIEPSVANNPLTDNPTTCTGKPLTTSLEVQTYQDPEHPSKATSSYPAITECERETFNPVLYASPTTTKPTLPRA